MWTLIILFGFNKENKCRIYWRQVEALIKKKRGKISTRQLFVPRVRLSHVNTIRFSSLKMPVKSINGSVIYSLKKHSSSEKNSIKKRKWCQTKISSILPFGFRHDNEMRERTSLITRWKPSSIVKTSALLGHWGESLYQR